MAHIDDLFEELLLDIVDVVNPIGEVYDDVVSSIEACKKDVTKYLHAQKASSNSRADLQVHRPSDSNLN